jgi:hypothetical protein
MDVFVDCSRSNDQGFVCIDKDCNLVTDLTGCCCIGILHPGGLDLANEWIADHPDLAQRLVRKVKDSINLIGGKPAMPKRDPYRIVTEASEDVDLSYLIELPPEPGEPSEVFAPVAVAEVDMSSIELPPEPEGEGTPEEVAALVDEIFDAPVPEDEQEIASEEGLPETTPTENLIRGGVPEEYVEHLLAADLDTIEKVLAYGDLSKVKRIGVKSREKILAGIRGNDATSDV